MPRRLRSFAALLWPLGFLSPLPASSFAIPASRSAASPRPSFVAPSRRSSPVLSLSSASSADSDDRPLVLLIGPGFLQLVVARALKAGGTFRPVLIAPQTRLDSFARFLPDEDVLSDALIGLPDAPANGFGRVDSIVFCSEEAVYGPRLLEDLLSWDGYAAATGPRRAVACLPVSDPVNPEKPPGWIPIFNNDAKTQKIWRDFAAAWRAHPVSSSAAGSLLRFGSLFGGGPDGYEGLKELGLDESMYKMSLENYRDMRERSFDRYRLGAQVLEGDDVARRPADRDALEKAVLKGEDLEAYRCTGGYPEQDRVCRHAVAQAVAHCLRRTGSAGEFGRGEVPPEFTVVGKCEQRLPTEEEWDELFRNTGPAEYPDPKDYVPPVMSDN